MNNITNLLTNDLNDRTYVGNIINNDMNNSLKVLIRYGKECYKIDDINKNIDINNYISKIKNLLPIKRKAYFDMINCIHTGSTFKVKNFMLHKIELYTRSNEDDITFIYYILENEQLSDLIFYEENDGITKLSKKIVV